MGEEGKSFGAILVAAVAIILGSKYLVTAMVVQLSPSDLGISLLADSTLATAVAGAALVLVAGAFVSAVAFARAFAVLTFAAIVVAARPWVAPVEPISVAEAMIAATVTWCLLLYDPIRRPDRTEVDDSTSATRVGSTLR